MVISVKDKLQFNSLYLVVDTECQPLVTGIVFKSQMSNILWLDELLVSVF